MNQCAVENREAIEDFVDEALDSLQGLSERLESFRLSPGDSEQINAVFRAIHSMKGCAAFLDLDAIKSFAHSLENSLDEIRKGAVVLSEGLQQAIVEGFDVLEGLLQEAGNGNIIVVLDPQAGQLLERVKSLSQASARKQRSGDELVECVLELAALMCEHESQEARTWGGRLQQLVGDFAGGKSSVAADLPGGAGINASALKPADIVGVRCFCGDEEITDRMAAFVELFTAHAAGNYDKTVGGNFIKNTNEFAEWAEKTGKNGLAAVLSAGAADFQMIFDSPMDLDENLLSIIWDHVRPALKDIRWEIPVADGKIANGGNTSESKPAAETDNENAKSPAEPAGDKAAAKDSQASKGRFVRVREERLDEFLEHVSRLFITSELFKDVHARMADSGQLTTLVDELRQINNGLKVESAALQHGVVSLRRVSVAGLFSKFPRMARTLAAKLNKKINVHVSGEETEIDKTLAEDLDAPLTHLIRNVVDHGIETPEDRKHRGVDETGALWLSAEETKSHIRITVRDDGRGIDPVRLRAKAVEKGVLSQADADAMCDEESLQLIFHPGFSTAEKVSDVSGRGVGMDVVRTTLADHDGEVIVESQVGVGTTIRLEIPIRQTTLVIDGLMVTERGQQYVVPFEYVTEINDLDAANFSTAHGRPIVSVRQGTFDAVTLSEVLGINGAKSIDPAENIKRAGALLTSRQGAFCLLVDSIVGHRQVVVSGLKGIISGAEKTAGVAQLGGGRLALVLNVPEIIKSL